MAQLPKLGFLTMPLLIVYHVMDCAVEPLFANDLWPDGEKGRRSTFLVLLVLVTVAAIVVCTFGCFRRSSTRGSTDSRKDFALFR